MKKSSDNEESTLFPHAIVWGAIGLWVANSFDGGLNGGEGFLILVGLGIAIPVIILFIIQGIRAQVLDDVLDIMNKRRISRRKIDTGTKS